MAWPAIIGGAAAIAGGAAVGTAVGGHTAAFIEPSRRNVLYWGNFKDPNVVPDPSIVMGLINSGMISAADGKTLLACSGIDITTDPNAAQQTLNAHAWAKWMDHQRPGLDPMQAMDMRARGMLDDDLFQHFWQKTGADRSKFDWYWYMLRNRMALGDLMISRNRELLNDNEFTEKIRNIGYVGQQDQGLIDKLRRYMPPVTDVIRFAVKDIFDPAVAGPQKLFDEFPEAVRKFGTWNGMDWESEYQNPATGAKAKIDELYWAAHWQPISPGQSYEMLHRVRPNNITQNKILTGNADLAPFTQEDVKQWLKVADYPKNIRDYLLAISYRPIVRRDIQALRNTRILNSEQVIQAYEDLGYARDRAEQLGELVEKKSIAKSAVRSRTKAIKSYSDAYAEGIIDKATAQSTLQSVLTNDPEVSDPENEAAQMITIIDLTIQTRLLRKAISAVRRDYLTGALTINQARDQLNRIGVVEPRLSSLLTLWGIELTRPRRVASTQTIVSWYVGGFIPRQEAELRLFNLGWNDADRALYLFEGDNEISRRQESLRAKSARDAQARARAAESDLRKITADREKGVTLLMRQSSPSLMAKWFREGKIDEATIRTRLDFMGWTGDNIERFMSDLKPEEANNAS